jgi:cation-transporting ATPase 13A1
LTAAFIGKQLDFGPGDPLFVSSADIEKQELVWSDSDDKEKKRTYTEAEIQALGKTNMLCINGEQYDKLILFKNCGRISRFIHVYARTSPSQKGIIVSLLNNEGHITLMCGDGTNDVGSLKRADVGLAIVNGVAPTKE